MKLRVISGKFGGRNLDAPTNTRTHPMSERIRNALFNSIGSELEGASVLDAFAGTGAVGFEALSRGAHSVSFVERDRVAQSVLRNNVKSLGVENSTTIISSSVSNWLSTQSNEMFDIIFADPPYNDLQLPTVKRLFGLLKPNGLMVLSHTGRGEVPIQTGIVVVDNRSYGNAYLTFFRQDNA